MHWHCFFGIVVAMMSSLFIKFILVPVNVVQVDAIKVGDESVVDIDKKSI